MRYRGVLIITALLPLLACGGGGPSNTPQSPVGVEETTSAPRPGSTTVGQGPSGLQDLSSGVTLTSPDVGATPGSEPPGGAAAGSQVEPSSVTVDLETQRIFLPTTGWLTADAFWDLYYNHPEQLPPGIDFDAVNQLGPMPPTPSAKP